MEVRGLITIFPRKVKLDDKEVVVCSGTISTKKDDGTRINKRIDISFSKEQFPEEKMNQLDPSKCYTLEVESGFLGAREFVAKGEKRVEIYMHVTKGTLKGSKEITKAPKDSDLPF